MKSSDDLLLEKLQASVLKERQATLQVLTDLREVERRMLYAKRGYSSLHLFCVKELKYSEGAASRRISSMRLMRDLPELEPLIESGSLSLSVLALTHSHLRREGIAPSMELFEGLKDQPLIEVERELARRFPRASRPERVTPISDKETEIRFTADSELYQDLILLQQRLGKPTLKETISHAVRLSLKKPIPRASTASEVGVRYIPASIKRAALERDGEHCSYQDPKTGRRCLERFALELDHLIPLAQGGKTTVANLALKCRAHNRLAALQAFGPKHMAQFYPSIR